MEQTHDILINRFFTGSTSGATNGNTADIQSNLSYDNKYYYNPTGTADVIVDYSNVRAFLANENNQKFVSLYYSFLTSSTLMNSALIVDPNTTLFIPTASFKAIYYDDEKLAESFNNFYNSSILRGISSEYSENPDIFNTSVRNQLLPDTSNVYTAQSVFHNYYFWSSSTPSNPAYSPPKNPFFTAGTGTTYYTTVPMDINGGDRDESTEERLVEIPINKENYYINILLLKRFTQTARIAFESCNNVIYKSIDSSTNFSQNTTDQIKHYDYFNELKEKKERSIDNSKIKVIVVNKNNVTSGNTIVQEESGIYSGMEIIFSASSIQIIGGKVFYPVESLISSIVEFTNTPAEDLENVTPQILPSKVPIQCFVNPNFITNENEYWTDCKNFVSFEFSNYYLMESGIVPLKIFLSHALNSDSTVGVRIINETTNSSDYNINSPYSELKTYKTTTVKFLKGETEKFIIFNSNIPICNKQSTNTSSANTIVIASSVKKIQAILDTPKTEITKELIKNVVESLPRADKSKLSFLETTSIGKIANSLLSKGDFVLTGSFALSKQGTVYKDYLHDLDFIAMDNEEKEYLNLSIFPDGTVLEGFASNLVHKQFVDFISNVMSLNLKILKVIRSVKMPIDQEDLNYEKIVYSIFTNDIMIELFFNKTNLYLDENNPKLISYERNLYRKINRGLTKDLYDMENFRLYPNLLSIEENSIIQKQDFYIQNKNISSENKKITLQLYGQKNNSNQCFTIGEISTTNIALETCSAIISPNSEITSEENIISQENLNLEEDPWQQEDEGQEEQPDIQGDQYEDDRGQEDQFGDDRDQGGDE